MKGKLLSSTPQSMTNCSKLELTAPPHDSHLVTRILTNVRK